MQLFFKEDISNPQFDLDSEESKHLIKVLRKSVGDEVHFTDGKGNLYPCTIIKADPKKASLKWVEKILYPEDDYYIHLAIGPTKNLDRMEWMLEKITEIGCHEISFLQSSNSERSFLKLDRLEKKIIAACKQSLKMRFPKLNPIQDLKTFVQNTDAHEVQKFIAYVDKENDQHLFSQAQPKSSYLILIGPEGDFSKDEIKVALNNGFKPCSLGKSRLRTETAGMAAVHILQLINSSNEI
jgi:16S rRNA (uracil1498-N3)-methyltransferase